MGIVKAVAVETRASRLRELMQQRQQNMDSIRTLQFQNFELEDRLVQELAQAGDYSVLNVNWSRLRLHIK